MVLNGTMYIQACQQNRDAGKCAAELVDWKCLQCRHWYRKRNLHPVRGFWHKNKQQWGFWLTCSAAADAGIEISNVNITNTVTSCSNVRLTSKRCMVGFQEQSKA